MEYEDTGLMEWREVLLVAGISMLSSIESNILGVSEYSYLTTIDKEATTEFVGMVNSLTSGTRCLLTLLCAFLSYRFKKTKMLLIVTLLISLIGCFMYILVECLPDKNRRFYMLVCYILLSVNNATSPLLRNHLTLVSTKSRRTEAYAIYNVAMMLSIVCAPIVQLAFSSISYPGLTIVGPIHFNIFSAPVYAGLAANLASIVIVLVFFHDREHVEHSEQASLLSFTASYGTCSMLPRIRQKLSELSQLNLPWFLIVVCLVQKFLSQLTNTTLSGSVAPLFVAVFGYSREKTVKIASIAQGVVGVMALILVSLFILAGKFQKQINVFLLFAFSAGMVVFTFIFTYPFSFISTPVAVYNETTGVGCNNAEYSWCDAALAPNDILFIVVFIAILGFAIPASLISLDTIYSNLLGNVDQKLMQGAYVFIDGATLTVGPLYAAWMFTAFGQGPLWIVDGVILLLGFVVWCACYKPLRYYR